MFGHSGYLTDGLRCANQLVMGWMRESDKTAVIDAAGVALPVVGIEFLARHGRPPAFPVVAGGFANGEGQRFQPP